MKIDAALMFNGQRFPVRIDLAVLAELQRRNPTANIVEQLSQSRLDVVFDLAAEALRTGARRAGLPIKSEQEYKDLLADHPDQLNALSEAIAASFAPAPEPATKKDMGAAEHPPTPAVPDIHSS